MEIGSTRITSSVSLIDLLPCGCAEGGEAPRETPQRCFLLGRCFQGRQKQKPGLSKANVQNILVVQQGCYFYGSH